MDDVNDACVLLLAESQPFVQSGGERMVVEGGGEVIAAKRANAGVACYRDASVRDNDRNRGPSMRQRCPQTVSRRLGRVVSSVRREITELLVGKSKLRWERRPSEDEVGWGWWAGRWEEIRWVGGY